MAPINYELFWDDFDSFADFDKLTGIFRELDLSAVVLEIGRHRKFKGRRDWPVESMLLAMFTMKVLQYKSVSGFVRELARNPSLMRLLGFPIRRCASDGGQRHRDDPTAHRYRVPSNAAMSRFQQTLIEVNDKTGCLDAVYEAQLGKVAARLVDFGQRIGYDGKAIRSHSTGKQLAHKARDEQTGKRPTSDPDASWGVHSQYATTAKGRERQVTKKWYGYELHLVADVRYELPISFRLTPAHEAETVNCRQLVSEFLQGALSGRTESFVADRGLDDNALRKMLYEHDILPVIDNRSLWRDDNPHPEQLTTPTRALHADPHETILYNEQGQFFCRCPQSGEIRSLYYQGREARRGTIKWSCPADAYGIQCQGRRQCHEAAGLKADAKTRIVRDRINMDHLRSHGPLPKGTRKWQRLYSERSSLERINSRIDSNFQMHDHFIRGIGAMRLHITLGLTAMLAGACMAIRAGKPEKMRCLVTSLAA